MAGTHRWRWPDKDPGDILDYAINVAGEISPSGAAPTGDTVTSATWTVPAGLTKVSQAESGTIAVLWLSGGTVGQDYQLNVVVGTAQGRQVDRDIYLRVRQK